MTVVVVYIGTYVVWVYVLLNRVDAAADAPWLLIEYAVLAVLNVATGYLARAWSAVLLPLVTAALAVPAGYVPDGRPEFPIWVGLLFLAPAAAVLLAAGVAFARVRVGQAVT